MLNLGTSIIHLLQFEHNIRISEKDTKHSLLPIHQSLSFSINSGKSRESIKRKVKV